MNFLNNNSKYYCKDEYLPTFPKDLFLKHLFKLQGLEKDCTSYALQRDFVHLSTSEPCIISPLIDVTEAKISYGAAAIPNLLKDALSPNKMKAYQAINSLSSMLYRPEKAMEAIRHNIVGRLVRLLGGTEDFMCICALACLRVLSIQPGGKLAIIKNECLLPVLKSLLKDSMPDVRYHAIITANTLAVNYIAVHKMVEQGFIQVVMDLINNYDNPNIILQQLLEMLELLLDDGDKARILAITCDALDVTGFFSNRDPVTRKLAAAVIAQLFHCPIGKLAATNKHIIDKIKQKINTPDEGFKSKLVVALMFATTDIDARKVAANASLVTDMLEIIANFYIPTELEVAAVKVLTNLAELPKVRRKLRFFVGNILSLPRQNREDVQRHIDTLIDTILWEP